MHILLAQLLVLGLTAHAGGAAAAQAAAGAGIGIATTPDGAVAAALRMRDLDGFKWIGMPTASPAGLPVPAPGISFHARPVLTGPGAWTLSMEVAAKRGDRTIARKFFALSRSEGGVAVVPRRPISAGQTVTADDVELGELPAGESPSAYASKVEQIAGRITTTRLSPGRPIPLRLVRAPWVVKRGSPVVIQVESSDMAVTVTAKAANNGAVGDVIHVINPSSGRVLQGRVTAEGRVVVGSGQ